jgi:iron(III) transport system substrate-binding protein
MLSRLIRRRWPIPVAVLVLVLAAIGVAVATTRDDGEKLVVYNGRSDYGDEQVFEDFEEATGIQVELRGG